jgi:hypothetical protein
MEALGLDGGLCQRTEAIREYGQAVRGWEDPQACSDVGTRDYSGRFFR